VASVIARRLALATTLASLVLAAPASALVVHPTTVVGHSFTGAACGSVDTLVVALPRTATNARILFPQVGELLPSDDDEAGNPVVATVTNAAVDRLGGRVAYTQRVRTYVRGFGEGSARRRPARLNVGLGALTSLSWRSWDGRVARGRGIGPGGEPVRVKLSRPRDCGRWRYLSVRYRYTGAVPPGASRSRLVRLDSTC
jgi:hypothetical protein